jgi:hypothetical protein
MPAPITATVARFRAEGLRWLRIVRHPKGYATLARCSYARARIAAHREAKFWYTAAARVVLMGVPRHARMEVGVEITPRLTRRQTGRKVLA